MTKRDILVVGAAPRPGAAAWYRELIGRAGLVIAADAGIAVCLEADRAPDVCVGDFDSADPADVAAAVAAGARVVRLPSRKDESDLDRAVAEARALGAEGLTLTACFSGRLDHTLAAVGTLLRAADSMAVGREPDATLYGLDAQARPVLRTTEAAGTLVSVFAMGGGATVSARGLEYPLESTKLDALASLGLSNVALGGDVVVQVASGSVLVAVGTPAHPVSA
jgi:thiamine pyrophosphokinase